MYRYKYLCIQKIKFFLVASHYFLSDYFKTWILLASLQQTLLYVCIYSKNPLYKKATMAEAPYTYHDWFTPVNQEKGLYLSCN